MKYIDKFTWSEQYDDFERNVFVSVNTKPPQVVGEAQHAFYTRR